MHRLTQIFGCALAGVVLGAPGGTWAQDPPGDEVTHIHVGRPLPQPAGIRYSEDAQSQTIRVGGLRADGAAARAGLKEGDRIVTANGCRVRAGADLDALLNGPLAGGTIELGVLRGAPGAPAPAGNPGAGAALIRLKIPAEGLTGTRGDDGWDGLSLAAAAGGLKVVDAPPGLEPPIYRDDLLIAIDAQPVGSVAQARAQLAAPGNSAHELLVRRKGRQMTLRVAPVAGAHAGAVRAPDAPCAP